MEIPTAPVKKDTFPPEDGSADFGGEYINVYTCEEGDTNGVVDSSDPAVKDVASSDMKDQLRRMGLSNNSPVCIFKPKVQVLDNWGWCNGVNADGTQDEDGRYESGLGECEVTNLRAWTSYKGEIIVVPSD